CERMDGSRPDDSLRSVAVCFVSTKFMVALLGVSVVRRGRISVRGIPSIELAFGARRCKNSVVCRANRVTERLSSEQGSVLFSRILLLGGKSGVPPFIPRLGPNGIGQRCKMRSERMEETA